MRRKKLDRRTLLRGCIGAAAVTMGLPWLEAMTGRTSVSNADEMPVRFMTFMFGNGVRLNRWVPSTTGTDWALSEELAPLAAVKDYCSVLSGFDGRLGGASSHRSGLFSSFAGHPGDYYDPEDINEARPVGPTIDQVVADYIGKDTYLRSLEVGNAKRLPGSSGKWMSHRGPNQPNAPMFNPQDVYARLFVGPSEIDGLRASILDAVQEDAISLRSRLGAADRQRLDAHLESSYELEKRLTSIPPDCPAPALPSATNEDVNGLEPMLEVGEAMADLIAFAFRCDMVRVASFMQSGSNCSSIYHMTGAVRTNHEMSHDLSEVEGIHAAVLVNMNSFAYLLERLRDTPDGDGNLLDHSVIMLGSELAEGNTHSHKDMPFVIAGGGCGRLKTPGVHIRSNGENTSNILLTAMQAAVPDIQSVGSGNGFSDTPIAELLTG